MGTILADEWEQEEETTPFLMVIWKFGAFSPTVKLMDMHKHAGIQEDCSKNIRGKCSNSV